MRGQNQKSSEKRKVVPSSKPDLDGSQAGPNALSTVPLVSDSQNDVDDVAMHSQDVQRFSDFRGQSNAFSMNLTAERSVHFSN